MTRRTRRGLERRLGDLENDADDYDIVFVIGGDADEGGAHHWDPDAGAYVNEAGHEIPPEDAPDGVDVVGAETEGRDG